MRSNGTAVADLWDTVNNLKYEVETGLEGTTVRRYSQAADGSRRSDGEYRPKGRLRINAPESSTDRDFRLVAVDGRGMFLSDAAAETTDRALGTAAAVGGPGAMAGPVTLYYWPVGSSLDALDPLPEAEARGLLLRAAAAAGDLPPPVSDNGLR